MDVWQAENCQNLHISNPKSDLQNINAHTKFGENPLTFTQVTGQKWNTDQWTYETDGRTDMDIQLEPIIPCYYHKAGYRKNQRLLQSAKYVRLDHRWMDEWVDG